MKNLRNYVFKYFLLLDVQKSDLYDSNFQPGLSINTYNHPCVNNNGKGGDNLDSIEPKVDNIKKIFCKAFFISEKNPSKINN